MTKQKFKILIMKTMTTRMKFVALALATIFTTGTAFANEPVNDKEAPQEIRYLGNINDLPVYRLTLNNDAAATYLVTIKDQAGDILYTERVSGKEIVRNYQFNEIPSYEYSLTFEVRNVADNSTRVYEINKTKKIYDEVAVSRVK